MTRVAALDLGTTRIKGGWLEGARLHEQHVVSLPAPTLSGAGELRESPAEAYLEQATRVLELLQREAPGGLVLGLASQRSSFTVWNARSGEPRLPLISWQDRRAAAWCARHRDSEPLVRRLTGLPLSPHYAGPKLAMLIERRPELRQGLADRSLRAGTLDSFVFARWSGGRHHATDATMAARTLMCDPRTGRWQPGMLALFGVPASGLPAIEPTSGRAAPVRPGVTVAASVADQASGALAVLGDRTDAVLVNLGTGGFVLRPTGRTMQTRTGYLAGPLLGNPGDRRFALEGTINGAATSVDRFAPGPTVTEPTDPAPEGFALPDDAGIGSPHWRSDRALTLSAAAERLDGPGKRRVVAEGIVFRVCEILEDLGTNPAPRHVILAGGLSRDPFFAVALAAALDRPVEVLEQAEGTLLGAAMLAAGRASTGHAAPARTVAPGPGCGYLRAKFPLWKRFLERLLAD